VYRYLPERNEKEAERDRERERVVRHLSAYSERVGEE